MPNIVYSVAERVEMVRQHEQGISYRHIVDHFAAEHPGRRIPSVATVRNIVLKFHKTGNIDARLVKVTQPSKRLSEEMRFNICLKAEEDPKKPLSVIARELRISKSSVQKVLRVTRAKSHKLSKHKKKQPSTASDENETISSQSIMDRLKMDENRLRRVCFSNESTILFVSKSNTQNVRVCSWRIQNVINQSKIQYQKLHVWTGIVGNKLIGPFFLDDILDGENYLKMLREKIVPALKTRDENDPVIWYQQDAAVPHYTADVCAYLNQEFSNRWIGKNSLSQRPTRVLDMSLLDLALWGRLKNILYAGEKIEDLSILQTKVKEIIASMDPETVGNTIKAFYDRGLRCGNDARR